MDVRVHAVALHTPEQALAILKAALAMVEDVEAPEHLEEAVFVQACVLLGARAPVVEQATMPVPLDSRLLRLDGRRGP